MTTPIKGLALLGAVGICLSLAFSACGAASSSGSGSATVVLTGKEGRPDVPVPDGPPPSKLTVDDIAKGSGPPAQEGDKMSVRYFSLGYESHQINEDHWDEPPISFTLGGGQVVDAWETGLRGIRANGRRELILPGKMTPTRAPEIYVVEALALEQAKGSTEKPLTRRVHGTGSRPTIHFPPKPPRKLVVRELKGGTGPTIRSGERLAVRYIGMSPETKFTQDFWSVKEPYKFVFGAGNVREGWEIGLKGMKLGARRELIVPSRLAYGRGSMVYVIELLAISEINGSR